MTQIFKRLILIFLLGETSTMNVGCMCVCVCVCV